jgi:4-amino-4-deoxy-L-arabinose transferase-like glycosyltransferase
VANAIEPAPRSPSAGGVHSSKDNAYIWGVFGLALSIALLMTFVVFARQGYVDNAGDPYDYGKIARGFLEHGFNKLTRRAASLYPTFLSVVYGAGGNDLVVRLIHCVLHAGTCALVVLLGRRLFNLRSGLIAGVFCAFHPMLLRYVPDLHMETWLTFFATLTVFCAVRFYDRPGPKNGFILGAVGAFTTLSKGVMLPFLVVYGAIWAVRALKRPKERASVIPGLAAMGLAMALFIAPWTYRNYQVSGHFVLLTPGTPDAFIRGYIFTRLEFATLQKPPYTDAENESNALFRQIAKENGTTWELDEIADDKNNSKYAKKRVLEHPFDTLRKGFVGLFTFWYEMTSLKNSLVPLSLAILNWTLAFVGMKRAQREGRPFWLVLLPIVVMNAFVAMLIPLGRYSVPILPCLSILAAFGVDTLLERRKRTRSASAPA